MPRIPALDGLRALAALLVVGFHARFPLLAGGFIGVDIFFVLSGFLITSLLATEFDNHGQISYFRFWARRLARLYPALLLMLVVFAITAPFLFPEADVLAELTLTGLYLSDYTIAFTKIPDLMQHSWSLAAEMKFYLLWPLVVTMLCRLHRHHAIAALTILFISATAWRMGVYHYEGWNRAYYAFDTRISGLVLGSLLAMIKWRPGKNTGDILAALGLSIIFIAAARFEFYRSPDINLGILLVETGAAAVIIAILVPGTRTGALLAHPALVKAGLWSYGWYLWHYPVARLFRDHFDNITSFLLIAIISLICAALSYELVEKRATHWLQGRIPKSSRFAFPVSKDF